MQSANMSEPRDETAAESNPQSGEEGLDPTPPPKKRIRLPNSCVVCRQRKIKCNKGRPSCEQCNKRGVPHLCYYEEPRWMNNLSGPSEPQTQQLPRTNGGVSNNHTHASTHDDPVLTTQVEELLLRLRPDSLNLRDVLPDHNQNGSSTSFLNRGYNPNDKVKLVDRMPFLLPLIMRKSRIEMLGSLSPVFDMKTDPFLKIVWLHMWKYLDFSLQNPAAGSSETPTSINFRTGAINNCMVHLLELRHRKLAFKKLANELRNSSQPILEIMKAHFPPRRTILSLLNRFFRLYSPFIPLIDEHQFIIDDVEKIIGGWVNMNEPPSEVLLTSPQDGAFMGILFAMMAISSMSLREKDFLANHDFALIKDKCTALYAVVAEQCMKQNQSLRKSVTSKYAIVAFLLNFYRNYAPEGDAVSNGLSGDIDLGYVISMVRSSGFHADPEELGKRMWKHSKKFTLWMKFWHLLMAMDASDAAVQGLLPRFLDDDSYDTPLPTYGSDLSPEEIFVIEDFQFMDRRTKLYRKMCRTLYLRKCDPTIGQLLETADELKEFSLKELGSLKDVLMKNLLRFAKVKKLGYLIELSTIEAGLRQRAIGYFHSKGNTKMTYEMFSQQVPHLTKLLSTCLNVSYNAERYFGHEYVFYIRPAILHGAIRCMLYFASLLIRCVQCIKSIPFEKESRLRAFRELQSTLLMNMERASQLICYINLGYYSAQRFTLGLCFFAVMLQDSAFDFDKARLDVHERMKSHDELKRTLRLRYDHTPGGVPSVTVPETCFMSTLLDTEIDAMRVNCGSDIREVLQPVVGERLLDINTRGGIFPSTGGPRSGHFSTPGVMSPLSEDQKREGESHLHKNVAWKFMSQKVDAVLAGTDTIKLTNSMMTPRQLAGEEEFTPEQTPSGDEGPELSAEEFGDLFALIDDYNWIGVADNGLAFEMEN